MSDPSLVSRSVMRFADGLLADDLPDLSTPRRQETVAFVVGRVRMMPSVGRLGVLVIGVVVDVIGSIIGPARMRRAVTGLPIPLVAEYPRLVRSLGYAYIWETWPDTAVTGAAA